MAVEIIEARKEKADVLGRAHAMAADEFDRNQKRMAIPTIIMSTIVGASAIASLGDFGKVKFWLDLNICVFSVTVAILTALQQYLDYATRSQKHAVAAAAFFALGRRWEVLMRHELRRHDVEQLDEDLTDIIARAPRVSIELQERAYADIQRQKAEARTFISELYV